MRRSDAMGGEKDRRRENLPRPLRPSGPSKPRPVAILPSKIAVELLQTVFDDTLSAAFISDDQMRLVAVNRAAAEFTGYAREELLAMRVPDLHEASDRETCEQLHRRVLADDQLSGRISLLRKDRSKVDIDFRCRRLLVAGKTYVHVTAGPTPEGTQAEEALSESGVRFKALYEFVHTGVIVQRADGRIVQANRVACDILGMTAETLQSKTSMDPVWEMILEDGTPVAGEAHPSMITLRTGCSVHDAVRGLFCGNPKHLRWLRINTKPFRFSSDGTVDEVLITLEDITRLKESERELQAAHRFLRTILDSFPGNVAVLTADGTIATCNESWRAFGQANGIAPEFLREGVNYLEVCRAARGPWSEEAAQVAETIEAILDGRRQDFEIEYPCHSPDRERWFNLQARGFTYNNERWVVLSHINVTERERAEGALRKSEADHRRLVEMLNEGIWEIDAEGCTTFVNPKMAEMLGYTVEEMKRRPLFEFMDQERIEDARHNLERRSHEIAEQHRFTFRKKNGEPLFSLVSTSPVLDRQGRYTGALAGITDVTEYTRMQEAVARSEALFRELFNHMTSGCAVYEAVDKGKDFVFKDFNQAAQEISQISRAEVIGQRVSKVFPDVMRCGLLDAFRRVWRTGMPQYMTATHYADERHSIWVENRVYRLPSGEIVAIYDDVTARYRAECDLRDYQDRLRGLTAQLTLAEERERYRIAAGLHDHIGQGLAMTKLALQGLAAGADERVTKALTRCCRDIDVLADEVRSLSFELSNSILYTVGLPEAIEAHLERDVRQRHGIAYQFHSTGDFIQLALETKVVLFRNYRELLSNVIRHAGARQVRVNLIRSGSVIVLKVEDDGKGFDPEPPAASNATGGHFGLFSVREQMQTFGGSLRVRSKPGQGTRILLKMPARSRPSLAGGPDDANPYSG
ncbi:PAS domain S-box protein [Anaerobaca lacustris]|uniref:Oxygen sensor histidine kinase NreB n=1 Tax=Anaerobaca lacustris TaxID=3044600 RepID=A0AAW6U7A9_9BACT|nr:PAS domain S-box protein [Sedimentisphaerales bacterium M17dextr]